MSIRVSVEDDRVILHAGIDEHALSPDEAWDLGDDLIIASNDLLPWEPVGFTTLPPWAEKVQVAVAMSNRLAVICDDHGAINYPGMRIPLSEVQDIARAHWKQQHSQVTEDAEGENGDGQTVPAVHDAVADAEAVAQAEDRSDQVQDDGKHGRPTPPPGGVMAW